MRFSALTTLVFAFCIGCAPQPQPTPTSTPYPRSELKMESFVAVDKTGAPTEAVTVQPGSTVKTAIVIDGLQNDGHGRVKGTVTLKLGSAKEKVSSIQLEPPPQSFEQPFVDGGKVSLTPSIMTGPTDPLGTYTLTAVVVDQSADLEVEKGISVTLAGPPVPGSSPTPIFPTSPSPTP